MYEDMSYKSNKEVRLKEIRNICERGAESMQFLTLRFVQNTGHGHKYEKINLFLINGWDAY